MSYCRKCKADSIHIIFAMESDKISKVICESCNAKHNYSKPKSLTENKTTSKTPKTPKSTATPKVKKTSKKISNIIADYDPDTVRDYSTKEDYNVSSFIRHPSFGIGFVTKKIGKGKIEVQFENGDIKLMIINKTI